MKNAKIVLVAEWGGWCGACAADRPLVLTRTGRQRLRTWLVAAADDSRPLVLTCRLCGTCVDVPLEQDDPPVAEALPEHERLPSEPAPVPAAAPQSTGRLAPAVLPVPSSDADVATGRQAVASALGTLLAHRSAAPAPVRVAAPAPELPLQRTTSSGGLAELQLLADGVDLLSSGRA